MRRYTGQTTPIGRGVGRGVDVVLSRNWNVVPTLRTGILFGDAYQSNLIGSEERGVLDVFGDH